MPLVDQPADLGPRSSFPEQPQEADPSTLDVLAAAERSSNLAGMAYDRFTQPKPSASAVPGFDPLVSIPKGYEGYATRFLDAASPQEMDWIKGRIQSELSDRRKRLRSSSPPHGRRASP